jgi:hypothetical protein
VDPDRVPPQLVNFQIQPVTAIQNGAPLPPRSTCDRHEQANPHSPDEAGILSALATIME